MNKKRYEEWLDEIYFIGQKAGNENSTYMVAKYDTALKALEMMGFDWKRNDEGEHRIFGGESK